jgi:peptidoglycan/xylan/chitin deacetylase (PgdA/CDA1 family)
MEMHDILRQDSKIWDLFTRNEEYNNPRLDQYNRFPSYASKNCDNFEPKASKYLADQGWSVEYPHIAPFAICLTHDIDRVYQSIPIKGLDAFRLLMESNPNEAIRSIGSMRSKKLPLCNFSAIMDLEEKYGAKSTFFFMAENPDEQDYTYNIEDFEHETGNIIDRGCEVGLHGGHTTYLDLREIREKKERLEKVTHKPILGYRNHYLRFRVPYTWEYLSQAGFQYDTTFGYADSTGFRNGMCHPFRPFDLNKNQKIGILEIPLIIMDHTLFHYMKLDDVHAWERTKQLIEIVEKFHGVLTILWHNNYFYRDKAKFYEKILKHCTDKGAWMTNGQGISQWANDCI